MQNMSELTIGSNRSTNGSLFRTEGPDTAKARFCLMQVHVGLQVYSTRSSDNILSLTFSRRRRVWSDAPFYCWPRTVKSTSDKNPPGELCPVIHISNKSSSVPRLVSPVYAAFSNIFCSCPDSLAQRFPLIAIVDDALSIMTLTQ